MRAALAVPALLLLLAGCGGSAGPSDTASAVPLPRTAADERGNCPIAYGVKAGTLEGRQVYVLDAAPGPGLSTSTGVPGAVPKFDDFPASECFSSSTEARSNGYVPLDQEGA